MDAGPEGTSGQSRSPKHRKGGPKNTMRVIRLVIDVGTTLWLSVSAYDGTAPTKVETVTIVLIKAVRAFL